MQLFVFVISWVSGICLMGSGLLAIYASYRIDVTSFAGPTAGAMLAVMGFALVMLGIEAYEKWQANESYATCVTGEVGHEYCYKETKCRKAGRSSA